MREYRFERCQDGRSLFVAATTAVVGEATELYADEGYFANPDFGLVATGGYHGYKGFITGFPHVSTAI